MQVVQHTSPDEQVLVVVEVDHEAAEAAGHSRMGWHSMAAVEVPRSPPLLLLMMVMPPPVQWSQLNVSAVHT